MESPQLPRPSPSPPGDRGTRRCQQSDQARTGSVEIRRGVRGGPGVPGLPSRGPHGGSGHCQHSLPSRHAAAPVPPARGSARSPQRDGGRTCGQPAPVGPESQDQETRRRAHRKGYSKDIPNTQSLQSCRPQSPGPQSSQDGLAATTTRAPPAWHSRRHRAPGRGRRGCEDGARLQGLFSGRGLSAPT